MRQKEFTKILDQALQLKKQGFTNGEIVKRFPQRYQKELAEFLELKSLLGKFKGTLLPPKDSFENLIYTLPNENVTKNNQLRYNFSKEKKLSNATNWSFTKISNFAYNLTMWKFALIAVVILLVAGFALFKFNQNGQNNLNSQTTQSSQVTNQPNQDVPNQPITTDNADSTIQQTDIAVSQASDQVDQDLKTLDQTSSQEDDLNNL